MRGKKISRGINLMLKKSKKMKIYTMPNNAVVSAELIRAIFLEADFGISNRIAPVRT
jgi:hypothetical protein